MFAKAELTRLQQQKDLLVLQCDARRLLLAAEWRKLKSPERWLTEAGDLALRHPMWMALLTAASGALAVRTLRKPGLILGGIGQLGKLASLAFSAWRLLGRK